LPGWHVRFGNELQAAVGVRGLRQHLDPNRVDARHFAAEVLEHQGKRRVKPHRSAAVTDGIIVAPAALGSVRR
jgi:hypothetical protein